MVEPAPSRRTKTVPVDSEQLMRLVDIGRQTEIYGCQADARTDNYSSILDLVLTSFEEEHINE